MSNDRHRRVLYGNRPQGGPRPQSASGANECGYVTSDVQPGNFGYLKFNMSAGVAECAGAATEALSKVADADALIIDLRDNGGGQPGMVAFISSYLFDKRTHLNDIWTRSTC